MARISALYATPEPNTPIWLYEGVLEFGEAEGARQETGAICFDWLPRPNVRFQVPDASAAMHTDDTTLTVPGAVKPVDALVTSVSVGSRRPTTISGSLSGPLEL